MSSSSAPTSTSLKVFRTFLKVNPVDGSVDASQIHSRVCYEAWLASRGVEETDAVAKKFYRTLSNHVSGVDGRSPFERHEEQAILLVLRVKQRWPCFPSHLRLGVAGFRSKGFCEKQPFLARAAAAATAAAAAFAGEEEEAEEGGEVLSQLEPQDLTYVQSILDSFPEYRTATERQGANIWKSVADVARFVILGRTPACSIEFSPLTKQQYVQDLCASCSNHAATTDKMFVLVWDGLCVDFTKRFVAQNPTSVDLFGQLVHPGASHTIVADTELPRLIKAGLWIVHNVGREYALPGLQMRLANGQVQQFDTTLWLDSQSYHVVVFSGTATS
ncbi:hypothetical protein BASA81_013257 [Batrachochytrium salamandrivorans]|nr:hypothetical protein BASA81_013257 [Batrachochytrium salamandrivorans]